MEPSKDFRVLSQTLGRGRELTLQSDLRLNLSKLHGSSISPTTAGFNQKLQLTEAQSEKWHEIGAAEYRRKRKQGLTALPGATLLSSGRSDSIPSRDNGRMIPIRILTPQSSNGQTRGIFLHFHGGGWVLNDEESSDVYLQTVADQCGLVCISLGYRLAPEHPFPAGPNDCIDGARWLIDNGPRIFGNSLVFIGGESAGANLAVWTTLKMLRSPDEQYARSNIKGLLLHYGAFSLHWQPGTRHFHRNPTLILDEEALNSFRSAYLPRDEPDVHTSPEVSPFHADLNGLPLPPLLVTCGTEDCLLEDNVFMVTRWILAGGEAVLRLFPGSPHGFIHFSAELHRNVGLALKDVATFVESKLGREYAQFL